MLCIMVLFLSIWMTDPRLTIERIIEPRGEDLPSLDVVVSGHFQPRTNVSCCCCAVGAFHAWFYVLARTQPDLLLT